MYPEGLLGLDASKMYTHTRTRTLVKRLSKTGLATSGDPRAILCSIENSHIVPEGTLAAQAYALVLMH